MDGGEKILVETSRKEVVERAARRLSCKGTAGSNNVKRRKEIGDVRVLKCSNTKRFSVVYI